MCCGSYERDFPASGLLQALTMTCCAVLFFPSILYSRPPSIVSPALIQCKALPPPERPPPSKAWEMPKLTSQSCKQSGELQEHMSTNQSKAVQCASLPPWQCLDGPTP